MAQWREFPERFPAMSKTIIRKEQSGDEASIGEVTRAAFHDHPHSNQTEHLIVDALRRAGVLAISLVAERSSEVVGHIAFSPVTITDGSSGWYGLGPVSVLPALQGQGIGQELVRAGLTELRALGARGCVLLGEPAYYGRFGFANSSALQLPGVPQEYFLALQFDTAHAFGEVIYHPAFSVAAT